MVKLINLSSEDRKNFSIKIYSNKNSLTIFQNVVLLLYGIIRIENINTLGEMKGNVMLLLPSDQRVRNDKGRGKYSRTSTMTTCEHCLI